ncbi:hypothetical protein EYR40_010273 [Pleurotus pulmonarius]|nr:hypothetical protein EYR36_010335 [Pleurotus pulmonarius]KAF4586261.1 hypothetical protein EYR38_010536 [Pleurotus pulmonarius]KAF4588719.1 hypothetical protein EYR40_010273 [Pleurotus pulmonarius]
MSSIPATTDCPILVWMLSLNREYTKEEYDACYHIIKECVPHENIVYNPQNADSFRQMMKSMLPLLMMRHRRIPRAKWRDCVTSAGKHWIEQIPDDLPPEKFLHSMIGYHLATENSLCGMAMTQGIQRKVVNIGLGMKQLIAEPRGVSVRAYVESFAHKLTPLELSLMAPELGDEVMLRRLCIIISLKQAYIKAIGQPIGFDLSRLEFNIPQETVIGDGHPLTGWEFRIFKANLGVARKDLLVEEQYQCVCAFFRGTPDTKFIWHDSQKELESWVQFINIDQMVKVIPKLTA